MSALKRVIALCGRVCDPCDCACEQLLLCQNKTFTVRIYLVRTTVAKFLRHSLQFTNLVFFHHDLLPSVSVAVSRVLQARCQSATFRYVTRRYNQQAAYLLTGDIASLTRCFRLVSPRQLRSANHVITSLSDVSGRAPVAIVSIIDAGR